MTFFQKYVIKHSYTSEQKGDPVKYPVRNKFVIYTRYTSGSSFVEELFNNHPYIFSMFEPINCLRKMVRHSAMRGKNFTNGKTGVNS